MAAQHVPLSLEETKEVMKKFQKPPIIKLSRSQCRKGNMQKVLTKYSETIRSNPLTVFQFPQCPEIQFNNPESTYLNVVNKKREALKRRVFSSLLFDENTTMTVQDYMELSKERCRKEELSKGRCSKKELSKERCSKEDLIEALWKDGSQSYSENNDGIEKFLNKTYIGMQWNLDEENGLRKSVIYPGINKCELYLGIIFTTSSFHQEDGDALSANYQIHGAPKVWWAIPKSEEAKLMEFFKQLPESTSCESFWRHKSHVLNFAELQNRGIQVIEYEQNPGDLVITNGFHQAANTGFNVNVAPNVAIEGQSWTLELIEKSVHTTCNKSCLYDDKSLDLSDFQIEPLYCDVCEKAYRCDDGYNEHFSKQQHKSNFEKKYPNTEFVVHKNMQCPYCPAQVPKTLMWHVKNIHQDKLFPKRCNLCRETFPNEDERYKHWGKDERSDKSARVQCKFCPKKFKYYMEAMKHVCLAQRQV